MYEAQDLEIHTQHPITIPTELPDLPIVLGTAWVSFNLVLQKPCRNSQWNKGEEGGSKGESLKTAMS